MLSQTCGRCDHYDDDKNECKVRYVRILNKGRVPMKKQQQTKSCISYLLIDAKQNPTKRK